MEEEEWRKRESLGKKDERSEKKQVRSGKRQKQREG